MHAILIIPAAQLIAANALMLTLFGGTGDNFSIGLNADGVDTKAATYYWCAIQATSVENQLKLQSFTNTIAGSTYKRYDMMTQKTLPWDELTSKGLKVMTKPIEIKPTK
ncbi:MAG: hypothetical protein Q7T74_00120 [Candidatus Saccharibacteria bacterium]|nr:hypothetical protein [Candidatus Saccharibacteria bacterium]